MGQYAEDVIDGFCDFLGDYTTKYNAPKQKFKHYKLTPAEKNIAAVRKELAILIKTKIKANPDANANILVNDARSEINAKYGKGWRERGLCVNSDNQWRDLSEY